MRKITIISSSIRDGRVSHRLALHYKEILEVGGNTSVDILDLKEHDFPLFKERYKFLKDKSAKLEEFTARLFSSDIVLVVTPVYNGGYPAALKNIVDLYFDEWKHKIVGIIAATYGTIPPFTTIRELQSLFIVVGATVIPTYATYTSIGTKFSEEGVSQDKKFTDMLTAPFISELEWYCNHLNK